MAQVFPFRPYRYAPPAGAPENLLTQPYDKISLAMRARYLSLSPHNLVRAVLGERRAEDSAQDNVYTRAARHLEQWIDGGVLVQEAEPSFYAYFQEFVDPDSGQRLTRKGFIGLGELEPYSAGVVHRHEQTLTGPKQDRMELLQYTRAQFELLFLLYPDAEGAIDRVLDAAAEAAPEVALTDEYGAGHRLWRIARPGAVAQIQRLMADKKLIIADGHHRYETALTFRDAHPELTAARRAPFTFVNMHSPGLRILATHRLVSDIEGFDAAALLGRLRSRFRVETFASGAALKTVFGERRQERIRVGVALAGSPEVYLVECGRGAGQLDVTFLHQTILDGMLGIDEAAVREQRYLRYIRGIDAALEAVAQPPAQAAFLLESTTIEQVAEVSFSGGVMPQKSTDFYPKLLSGLTIYRFE